MSSLGNGSSGNALSCVLYVQCCGSTGRSGKLSGSAVSGWDLLLHISLVYGAALSDCRHERQIFVCAALGKRVFAEKNMEAVGSFNAWTFRISVGSRIL